MPGQVRALRSERRRNRQRAFEHPAECQFLGHPHSAVELDRAFADHADRVDGLDYGGADCFAPIFAALAQNRALGQHLSLERGHLHVGEPVAEDLKAGDRHAELLALQEVGGGIA